MRFNHPFVFLTRMLAEGPANYNGKSLKRSACRRAFLHSHLQSCTLKALHHVGIDRIGKKAYNAGSDYISYTIDIPELFNGSLTQRLE